MNTFPLLSLINCYCLMGEFTCQFASPISFSLHQSSNLNHRLARDFPIGPGHFGIFIRLQMQSVRICVETNSKWCCPISSIHNVWSATTIGYVSAL
ncbi:hypothetical protein Hdeb2414_s0001g00002861 [Helianthus debilis subsp. tardiflorus]